MAKPDSKSRFNKPQEGGVVEREIFRATVSYDGRFGNYSQEQRNDFINQVYKNTLTFILKPGITIPVKCGHFDQDQKLKGYIVSISKKSKQDPELGRVNTIWGKMFLYEPYYSDYCNDRYPSMSAEIPDTGSTETGKIFKDHISAVALLGTDVAAFPLMEKYMLEHNLTLSEMSFFSKVGHKDYKLKEFEMAKTFDKQNLIDALIAKLTDMLPDLISEIWDEVYPEGSPEEEATESPDEAASEGDEPKKEMAADKEDKTDKDSSPANGDEDESDKKKSMKSQYAALNKDRAELMYDKLVFAGKIGKDQKANFMTMSEKTGIDFAVSVYSAMDSRLPPKSKNFSAKQEVDVISKERLDAIEMIAVSNPKLREALLAKAKEGK